MSVPLFFGLSAEHVREYTVKGLAVGGAFLVGYILAGLIVAGIDRWLLRKKIPHALKRVARVLSGLAAAILAAYQLFGSGGMGLFGAGGNGSGSENTSIQPVSSSPAATAATPRTIPSLRTADVPPADVILRVTILGGNDVKAGRFYQVEAEPKMEALTFEELKTAILAQKRNDKKKFALMLLFPRQNALPRDHPAVTRVDRWAEQIGIDVVHRDIR